MILKIERHECGWMLFRDDLPGERHGHFAEHKGALQVKWCIEHGLLPLGEYFRESCRRLLTEEEYDRLSPKKAKQKTIRRCG